LIFPAPPAKSKASGTRKFKRLSLVVDDDFVHLIALTDGINYIQTLHNPAEAGMIAVEVCGIFPAVANEKLGTAGIAAGMCHGQHATVMKLIASREFAINLITRATGSGTMWATSLNDEIGDNAMKSKAIVITFLCKAYKVFYSVRGILIIKFDLHYPFVGVYFSCCHGNKIFRQISDGMP
jgi:hypothetical protein